MIRVLTGLLMALLVSLGLFFLGPVPLKLVIAGLGAIVIFEYARMALPKHPTSSILFTVISGVAVSLAIMLTHDKAKAIVLAIPLALMGTFVFYLLREHSIELVFSQVARSFFGAIYGGVLFSFLGLLRDLSNGTAWLFMVLSTTFAADTGAYVAGHLFGRHKLAPRVSPSKTVEGLLGGLILSTTVAFFCKFIINNNFSITDCLCVGAITGLLGPLGDLSESLIKRSVGVKDSGALIPGHGGLLDRVDALLFTSPFVYYYAAFLR